MNAPGRLIRFVGLARSGNHAIINWTLKQLQGRWCFLNCVQAKTDPFESARPMDDGARHATNVTGAMTPEAARSVPLDHLAISLEDSFLRPSLSSESRNAIAAAAGPPREELTVIVLRDPYNLFASRRGLSGAILKEQTALRVWKQHARACLGETRGLNSEIVMANYNAWVRDPAYRRSLAERLGLSFTDAGRNEVVNCGGGSSFDGRAMNGRAEKMRVTERWRRFAGEEQFGRLFDPDTHTLASRLFPSEREARHAIRVSPASGVRGEGMSHTPEPISLG